MDAETQRTNGLQVLDFAMRRVAKSKSSVLLAIDKVQAHTVITTLEVVGVITEAESREFERKLDRKVLEVEGSFDATALKS
jgi:hypothetical protein